MNKELDNKIKDLKINDMICVKLREGSIKAIVKEVNHE